MSPPDFPLTIGQCATLACMFEATAPKPGNVHRGADFEDVSYPDFLLSAVVIGPILDDAANRSLGQSVLAAVEATRAAVGTNTNLGTILLLTPLAAVGRNEALTGPAVGRVLAGLGPGDARDVYRAILLARPGGMGQVDADDLHEEPPEDLLVAMEAAAGRDLIARQLTKDFQEIFELTVPWLVESLQIAGTLSRGVVQLHLRIMAQFPDSLIARKCGQAVADDAAHRAGGVLDAGPPGEPDYDDALSDLDFWLRADGHRRNPGTTADLVAASLFVALRNGIIEAPWRLAQ